MKTPHEEIFGVPAPAEADAWQDAKHQVAMARAEQAARLRLQAVINRRYARSCRETYLATGRESASYMAEVHEACAAKKEAQAELIFPSA